MATIKPFKGMRFTKKAGEISELCCPPYDIISDAERESYLERNPHNIIRLELPKGDDPYNTAAGVLECWLDEEILKCDMDEGIYIYEQEFKEKINSGEVKSLKGIVCRVKIEDFENNVVLPHEETLSKAKKDRFELTKATSCNFSQIYSLYPDKNHITRTRIDNVSNTTAPRYEIDDGCVIHRMWVINDKVTIDAICDDFVERKLYIADGHHRYETSINYRNYCRENKIYNPGSEYVMMYLADMADEGLVVFPTHRLIKDMDDFDSDRILSAASKYFDIEYPKNSQDIRKILEDHMERGEKAFGFYAEGKYAVLKLRNKAVMDEIIPNMSEAYRCLDVSILHSLILENILGIDKENMANQKNLTYTRSFSEAVSLVDSGDRQCAFFLNPTAVDEIGQVAQNGEKMPQKSTYFYPKVITGFVMNNLKS